jgi:aminopeptidase N
LAGVLLLAACAPPAEPVAVASRRTGEATNPTTHETRPSTTPSTSGPAATSTTVTGEPAAPTTVAAALSRSTSAGDRRYPRLGSTDIDVEQYVVELEYDTANVSLTGRITASGRFVNATDQIALDAAGPHVTGVTGDDGALTFTQADDELIVALDAPEPAGATFAVSVEFTSTVPESGNYFERAGLFRNVDGPGVWSVNEPDGTSTWLPVNDHPTDKAAWRFAVTVPEGLSAIFNGEFEGTDRDDATGSSTWTWNQREPMASYLVLLLIGEYEPREGGRSATGVELDNVAEPNDADDLTTYTDLVDRQLSFFTDQFGTYPFDRYGIALADSASGLAMETQGLPLFSQDDLDGSLGYIQHLFLAHELAHQWFGDAVSPAQWDDIWLNEGWATYAEWMWLDHEGFGTLDGMAQQALAASSQGGGPISRPDVLLGGVTYDGGGAVLHALRLTIGDDAFFTGARAWVADHMDSAASTDDFQATMEAASGRDLDDFFATWVHAPDRPDTFPTSS